MAITTVIPLANNLIKREIDKPTEYSASNENDGVESNIKEFSLIISPVAVNMIGHSVRKKNKKKLRLKIEEVLGIGCQEKKHP
ncbi:hypothetical protein AYI69_g7930 [Smittium culicis]|uniref:Uncharacterized protein n=1 Tax=Smittium culicis TaxID=133412 RepID=A0A1R1XNK5_9FUNG|nr:hypothetical protein AYI69_g7930 [Smittium culicis]